MEKLSKLVGRELAGFKLVELIEEGGMATVFRGVNLLDASICRAIKVVHPQLVLDEVFTQRFAEEARILERLAHPNVVRFHGARWEGELLLMELELLQGQSLSRLAREGPRPMDQVIGWIQQAAEGVAAAHELGIVHRDIKPANLFLTRGGVVKVLDFGIARPMDRAEQADAPTRAGTVPGTPAYMAPELCMSGAQSTRSDVYALGLTLYELLLGRHPMLAPNGPRRTPNEWLFAQVQQDLPPLRRLRPDAPEALAQVVARATAKEPEQRYGDCRELADAVATVQLPGAESQVLAEAAKVDGAGAVTPVVAAPQVKPQGRKIWIAVGALVVVGATMVLVAVLHRGQPAPRAATPAVVSPPAATLRPAARRFHALRASVTSGGATCLLHLEGGETRRAPAPCLFEVPAGKKVRLELLAGEQRLFGEDWVVSQDRTLTLERKQLPAAPRPAAVVHRPDRGRRAKQRPARRVEPPPAPRKVPLKDDIVAEP